MPVPARDRAFAAGAGAVLAAYNNVIGLRAWHDRWYVPLNVCATCAIMSAALARGLTAADIGIGRGSWRLTSAGVWWASAAAVGWVIVATLPATRQVLDDRRSASLAGREVAYQAVVRIPLGTVLWEEVAFRGVLQASLRRVLPSPAAMAVTSGVFGLWHVRPTVQALRANGLAASRVRAVAGAGAGVAVMAAGGVVLSWLREHSGGVAAPIVLHLVTNSGAAVAAWAVKPRGLTDADPRAPDRRSGHRRHGGVR